MDFKIGDTVYILLHETTEIIPAIIVEKIISENINGQTVAYKFRIGPPDKQKIVSLSKLDGEVFTDVNSIRETLINRINSIVDISIQKAQKLREEWYSDILSQQNNIKSNGE